MNDSIEPRLRQVEQDMAVYQARWEVTEKMMAKMGDDVARITEVVTTARGAAKMGWAIIVTVATVAAFITNMVSNFLVAK